MTTDQNQEIVALVGHIAQSAHKTHHQIVAVSVTWTTIDDRVAGNSLWMLVPNIRVEFGGDP